jgi:deoxycytidine triphosphate deaminase
VEQTIIAGGGVLSNREILRALNDGRLKIVPSPAWETPPGEESLFDVDSVTLRLSGELTIPLKGQQIDLSRHNFKEKLRQGKHISLQTGEQYPLGPQECILALTVESITFASERIAEFEDRPLLCGQLSGLSRNARFFIGIHLADQMHGGDNHPFTLEIFNLHPRPWWFSRFGWLIQYRWFQHLLNSQSKWITWIWWLIEKPTIFYLTAGLQRIAQLRILPLIGDPEVEGRGGNMRGQNGTCGTT